MKLKHILYMMCILPFLGGCNNEDDIDTIFASGTWYVVNYFTKADWDKKNGEPLYKSNTQEGYAALEIISKFSLTFEEDGTFEGNMQNETFEGTWSADGKKRSIQLNIKGNPNTTYRFNKEFIESLKTAVHYQGDSNVLLLGPENKKSYIQFRHK